MRPLATLAEAPSPALRRRLARALVGVGLALAMGCASTPPRLAEGPEPEPAVAPTPVVERAGMPVPAGDLRARVVRYAIVVYHARADLDLVAAIRSMRGLPVASVDRIDALDAASAASFFVATVPASELPPPTGELLRVLGRGLEDDERAALGRATEATTFVFRAPIGDTRALLRASYMLTAATAATTGGVVWDDATRRFVGPREWLDCGADATAADLDVVRHVNVHVYQDGRMLRMVSLGMEKLGLPDVVVRDVPKSASSMPWLVNVAAQTLVERPTLAREGALDVALDGFRSESFRESIGVHAAADAPGRATVGLAWGARDEGDADNRLVELVWPGAPNRLQERQFATLAAVFGPDEEIASAAHDDAELAAASARARDRVAPIAKRFSEGPPEGETLSVKAPFATTSGASEWMWVEVLTWDGDRVSGILRNEPVDVPSLHAGARVTVAADRILDYVHVRADGSKDGGETDDILRGRRGE